MHLFHSTDTRCTATDLPNTYGSPPFSRMTVAPASANCNSSSCISAYIQEQQSTQPFKLSYMRPANGADGSCVLRLASAAAAAGASSPQRAAAVLFPTSD